MPFPLERMESPEGEYALLISSVSCEDARVYSFYVVAHAENEYSPSDLILTAQSPNLTAHQAQPFIAPDPGTYKTVVVRRVLATVAYGWASPAVVKIGVGEDLRVVAAHLPRQPVSLLLERVR